MRWIRGIARAAVLAAGAVLVGGLPVSASPGALDDSFSGNGWMSIDFGGDTEVAEAIAQQTDGKIVLTGVTDAYGTTKDIGVARVLADGGLDASFSGDGLVHTGFSGPSGAKQDIGKDVAIAPNGAIVVAGYSGTTTATAVVARFGTGGGLDRTLNGTGKVELHSGRGSSDWGLQVAVRPNGTIIVAGETKPVLGIRRIVVFALNANGTPDTSFSGDGKRTIDFGTKDTKLVRMELGSDGYVTLAGTYGIDPVAVRVSPQGGLDSAFGQSGGKFVSGLRGSGLGMIVRDMAVGANGRLVFAVRYVAADQSVSHLLIRTTVDATDDDLTYAGDGTATVCTASDCELWAVALTGQRVISGGNDDAGGTFLARQLGSGGADASWQPESVVHAPINDMLAAGGKLVVVGSRQGLDWWVARYLIS